MEGSVIQMQEIFHFQRTGTEADGTVVGDFHATGLRPRCMDEMIRRGILFDRTPCAGANRLRAGGRQRRVSGALAAGRSLVPGA